jgi:hypothetical protein
VAYVVSTCLLVAACAGSGPRTDKPCVERKEKRHKLTIVLKDGKPEKVLKEDDKDDALHACPGDDIRWTLQGADFELQFKRKDLEPFGWPEGKRKANPIGHGDRAVSDVVSENAPRDTPLDYSVTANGNTLDPQIIIDK